MAYKVLTADEQDEILVNTLQAQETDHYVHGLNAERYESMLEDLPEGPFRTRIETLLAETQSRTTEVETILAALDPQLPPQARIDAAKARLKAREEAAAARVR